MRQAIFPTLMDLAAHDTNYVVGARAAITSIDPAWLEAHLPAEVDRILSAATDDPSAYDPYRRLAELLQLLHSPYLHALVERARLSSDADVREVAEDF